MKYIGYWRHLTAVSELPIPQENSATAAERATQIAKLRAFQKDARLVQYRGGAECRICGKRNGSGEYQMDEIAIPEGLMHYVKDHNVLVPDLLQLMEP